MGCAEMSNYLDLEVNFDLGDCEYNPESEIITKKSKNDFIRVKRHKPPKMCKYHNAQAMVSEIGDIEEGDHINAIVSGDFIAGDFIEAYLEVNKLTATEILISTLSMSSENVDSLVNIQNLYLTGPMGLIISDFFFSHEKYDGVKDIAKNLGDGHFALAVAGIHTKITLIKTECGKHIIIGGSANLRSSMNIEQITIDNCAEIYAFHREWMADILNKYQATGKMLRRGKLWAQLAANQGEQRKPQKGIEQQN